MKIKPDTTLEEAAGNGDGTYRLTGLVQFLMAATAGVQYTDEQAQQLVDEAVAKAKARKAKR